MRQLVRAALPLATGIILDPFMGSGATIAAAKHLGLESVGIEIAHKYFGLARRAIPLLARFEPNGSAKE
jgi:site-specific DNA-methyltransferase (adenine-specific)